MKTWLIVLVLATGLLQPMVALGQGSGLLEPGNIVVVSDGAVREFTPGGRELQSITMSHPNPGPQDVARDVIVYDNGSIGVFNGTFQPFLTTAAPDAQAGRLQPTCSGWSTVDRPHYGGIGRWQAFVFVTDMVTQNSVEARQSGILRFNLRDFSCTRFAAGVEFTDLAVGWDGLVYGLAPNKTIKVYDPSSLDFIRNIIPPPGDFRRLAVNRDGVLYLTAGNGSIQRLNPEGALIGAAVPSGATLIDIDLSEAGRIVLGSLEGRVLLTDESLSSFTSFEGGRYVGWVPRYERDEIEFLVGVNRGLKVLTEGDLGTGGYAVVEPQSAFHVAPSGLSFLSFSQNGVVVSEASIVASEPVTSGRAYVEVDGLAVRTGLAVANPGVGSASVEFAFVDSAGNAMGETVLDLDPGEQRAAFVGEAPFAVSDGWIGAVSFTSSAPVLFLVVRDVTNEQAEHLMTTLPVHEIAGSSNPLSPSETTLTMPHFADGTGWSTDVVLVNPTDQSIEGTLQFLPQTGGSPLEITVDGVPNIEFAYSIPARSATRVRTDGSSAGVAVGSVRLDAASGSSVPAGFVLFRFISQGTRLLESSLEGSEEASRFRFYGELSGDSGSVGSVRSGVAVSNLSSTPATVTVELFTLDGTTIEETGALTVSGLGQVAVFLDQIPGLENLATPFTGTVRLDGGASRLVVARFRGRVNARSDFLIASTPALNEDTRPRRVEIFFPHRGSGGSYTAEFVLFSGLSGQASAGSLRFLSPVGSPVALTVR